MFSIEGQIVSTGAPQVIALPIGCDRFELYNYTQQSSTANPGVVKKANWFQGMPTASALVVKNTNSAATDASSLITSAGFTFVDPSNPPVFAPVTITSVSQANPAVVTTSASHGYVTGDYVYLQNVTGQQQLSGMLFYVTVTGATTFTIDVNTSAFANAGSGGVTQKIFTPGIFQPAKTMITAITQATQAQVTTSIPHNLTVGAEVDFVVPSQFGMIQLNSIVTSGVPAIVVSIVDAFNFTINVNTSGFTAFAFPVTTAVPFTQAQVVPVGAFQNLDQATYNNAVTGMYLGSAICGASSDVLYYMAYKADKAYPQ